MLLQFKDTRIQNHISVEIATEFRIRLKGHFLTSSSKLAPNLPSLSLLLLLRYKEHAPRDSLSRARKKRANEKLAREDARSLLSLSLSQHLTERNTFDSDQ